MRLALQVDSDPEMDRAPFTGASHIWMQFAAVIGDAAAALRDETATPEDRIKCAEVTLRKLLSRGPAAAPCHDNLLSPRESGVLSLIGQGQSNKSIARSLGIAPETVKAYAKQIFRKMNVQNRAEPRALFSPT